MKKRFASLALALCMSLCFMLPSAGAAEVGSETTAPGTAPFLAGAAVSGNEADPTGGSLCLSVPSATDLAGASISLTTSEAVTFQATTEAQAGELYAASASDGSVTLRFAINTDTVDMNTDAYSINLTSSDNITWTGSFSSGFHMTADALAAALNLSGATLRAGTMCSSAGVGNAARTIYCNADAGTIQLVLCDPTANRYSVLYHYGSEVYTWSVPAGAKLVQVTLPSNLIVENWYTDAAFTTEAVFGGAVNANTEVYAKLITAEDVSGFATGLQNNDAVLYIRNADDWASFVNSASQVSSSQRVELMGDIDCANATYTALTFAGDFNGNNKTISNATFNASGENSGLFAAIGEGQVVANLTLSNITVKNATNAGVLAGSIDRATVQNVQVRGGGVTGRNAGGMVGYTFLSSIRYCSARNTRVTGSANGGGIAGISYSQIIDCYSVCSPTALLSNGRGGISGKNLESSVIRNCWCTYGAITGTNHGTAENYKASVKARTPMEPLGLDATYWSVAPGYSTDFTSAVTYLF